MALSTIAMINDIAYTYSLSGVEIYQRGSKEISIIFPVEKFSAH